MKPNITEGIAPGAVRRVCLDAAARRVTVSSSFRELVEGCGPATGYTPTLRPNAFAHGSDGERAVLRLRRGLHRFGVAVYPAYGTLRSERS
jgi:hypothetical protein